MMASPRTRIYSNLRLTSGDSKESLFRSLNLINNSDINAYLRESKAIVAEEHRFNGEVIYYYSGWKILGAHSLGAFLFEPNVEFEAKCLHEVIPGECSQKMRFDIDIDSDKLPDEEERHRAAGVIIKTILTALPGIIQPYHPTFDPKFIICASHGPHKVSYHVILHKYYFDNARVCKEIFLAVRKECPEAYQQYLDSGIYKSTSNLRFLHCHKLGDKRVKRLVTEQTFDGYPYIFDQSLIGDGVIMSPVARFAQQLVCTLITDIMGCDYVKFPVKEEKRVVVEVKDEFVEEAAKILRDMFPDMDFRVEIESNNWKKVFYRPDQECLLCNRRHEKEGHNYLVFYRNGGVSLRCLRDDVEKRSIVLIEGKRRGRKSQIVSIASTSTESQPCSSKLKEGPLSEVDEDYQREFRELQEIFNVLNIDMNNEDEMWEFAKTWLTIFAPGIIAEMLIPIVKESVYLFGLKTGLTWSERAKLYLQSPSEKFTPEWYFKGVLRMLALVLKNLRKAFDGAMGENRQRQSGLNTLLKKEGITEDETKRFEKELKELEKMLNKLTTFHSIIQKAYAKCNQVTFKDHVCKELVENLIIKRIDQVRDLLQDFSSPSEWLPLAGTQKLNLRTLEIKERTRDDKFFKTINFGFTYNESHTEEENFSWSNKLLWQIAAGDQSTYESLLKVLFLCFIGVNIERAVIIVFGAGSNGKSLLFVVILKKIMGGLAGMLPEDMVMETLNQVHSKNDSWMKGVYAAVLDDPKEYSVLDTGKFKNLGNIEGGQYVRDSGEHGNGSWMVYQFLPLLLLNNNRLRFSEALDDATLNRLLLIKLLVTFLEAARYDALKDEEKASGLYIREYSRGTFDDLAFLQGMFNNIMIRGSRLYWETKRQEKRVFHLDRELLEEVIRLPNHDFKGWFESVTTPSGEESRLSLRELQQLYEREEGIRDGNTKTSSMERERFRALIKKWIPKSEIFRSSENGRNGQYFLRDYTFSSYNREVEITQKKEDGVEIKTRVLSLHDWFGHYCEPCGDSFPFIEEVHEAYNTYLETINRPKEAFRGFATKLSNALPSVTIRKKIVNKVSSQKLRVWGYKIRGPISAEVSEPLVGSSGSSYTDQDAINQGFNRSLLAYQ